MNNSIYTKVEERFAAVPDELKMACKWVVWRYVEDPSGGKPRKLPLSPITGENASSTDPATWGTWQQAMEAMATEKYQGVMMPLEKIEELGLYVIGIDWDGVAEDDIDPIVLEEMEAINSYTELSPSGKGLRIIAFSEKPLDPALGSRRDNFEIYDHARFISITGAHIPGSPATIETRTDEVLALQHKRLYRERPVFEARCESSTSPTLSDEQIIEKLNRSKSGDKFRRLWSGDVSDYAGDDSRADLALIQMLAFYTQDAGQIERLMRMSSLRRDKWNKNLGYMARTIKAALSRVGEVWTPKSRVVSGGDVMRPEFIVSPSSEKQKKESQDSGLPAGYFSADGMLWFRDKEGDVAVSTDLRVIADSSRSKGGHRGLIIEWIDPLKKERMIYTISSDLIMAERATNLATALWDMRIKVEEKNLLRNFIYRSEPNRYITVCEKPGWTDGLYVRTGHIVKHRDGTEMTYCPDAMAKAPAGTLREWQDKVGLMAVNNSRLAFALCVSFASVLLDIEPEYAGFHYYGLPGISKSISCFVAASVWGNPREYKSSWKATANGMEAICEAHNDALLVLDEIGEAKAHEVPEMIYMVANGKGKTRMTKDLQMREIKDWRLLYLSSGEFTIKDYIKKGGQQVKGGQLVRCMDIPADAGKGMGALEDLHGLCDKPKDFAEELDRRTMAYYGVVGNEWIKIIVRNKDKFRSYLRKAITKFVESNVARHEFSHTTSSDSEILRVLNKFGLVAAAGELATGCGLLPWPKGEATRAAEKCFDAWYAQRGHRGSNEKDMGMAQIRMILENSGESCFGTETEPAKAIQQLGIKKKDDDGQTIYCVYQETFKTKFCAGYDWRTLAKELKLRGYLAITTDRKSNDPLTKVIKLSKEKTVRVYAIKESFLLSRSEL